MVVGAVRLFCAILQHHLYTTMVHLFYLRFLRIILYHIQRHFFVIVKAFYPLLLIVSYKFGVLYLHFYSRALLGALYLFSFYALRRQSALRNLIVFLGINIFSFTIICIYFMRYPSTIIRLIVTIIIYSVNF